MRWPIGRHAQPAAVVPRHTKQVYGSVVHRLQKRALLGAIAVGGVAPIVQPGQDSSAADFAAGQPGQLLLQEWIGYDLVRGKKDRTAGPKKCREPIGLTAQCFLWIA